MKRKAPCEGHTIVLTDIGEQGPIQLAIFFLLYRSVLIYICRPVSPEKRRWNCELSFYGLDRASWFLKWQAFPMELRHDIS